MTVEIPSEKVRWAMQRSSAFCGTVSLTYAILPYSEKAIMLRIGQVGSSGLVAAWMLWVTAAACEREQGLFYRDLAVSLYKQGQLDAATVQLRELVRFCPEDGFYAFMLGNALYR